MASPTRGLCPLDPRRRAAAVVSAARRESPVPISQTCCSGLLARRQCQSRNRQNGVWGLRPRRAQHASGVTGSRAEPWPSLFESNLQLLAARAQISLCSRLWGSAPGPRWGRRPQTPISAARLRLGFWAKPVNVMDFSGFAVSANDSLLMGSGDLSPSCAARLRRDGSRAGPWPSCPHFRALDTAAGVKISGGWYHRRSKYMDFQASPFPPMNGGPGPRAPSCEARLRRDGSRAEPWPSYYRYAEQAG